MRTTTRWGLRGICEGSRSRSRIHGNPPLGRATEGTFSDRFNRKRWGTRAGRATCIIVGFLALTVLLPTSLYGQTISADRTRPTVTALDPENSPYKLTYHSINKMKLVVSNRGTIGKPLNSQIEEYDAYTGEVIRGGLVYPRGSRRWYLGFIDLWVGAMTRTGPKVSTGVNFSDEPWLGEMMPSDPPGDIQRLSTVGLFGAVDSGAVSEEDLISTYTDSLRVMQRLAGIYETEEHNEALGISVSQSSHGWSIGYAEDFVLFNLRIKNESNQILRDVYVGLHIDGVSGLAPPYRDCDRKIEMCGFIDAFPSDFGCGLSDTLNLSWHASASGVPYEGEWLDARTDWIPDFAHGCYYASTRGVQAVVPLFYPTVQGASLFNYNWWSGVIGNEGDFFYFEPTRSDSVAPYDPRYRYRNSDADQYRWLSSREIDFPPYKAASINSSQVSGWRGVPADVASEVTMGLAYPQVILSWGPVTLTPGAEVPLTFAIVGGENLHVDPDNYLNLPHNPHEYEANLDFSDLQQNALMAQWLYDNPGIDTDGDGYKGEFRVCVRDSVLVGGEWVVNKADTQWYKGDGIPDYRGALPPPAPEFWLTPTLNGVHVRFNGQVSETDKDIFLQKPDFEGYRVYFGRDERQSSLQLVGSYDLEDYEKYYLDLTLEQPTWQLEGEPYSKEELRCLHGKGVEPCEDSTFEPLGFTQLSPYRHPDFPNDSIFWFKKHEYNASEFGVNTPIKKRFPDVPDPRTLPADSITDDMYTEDGYWKFYEYEMTIENLLPTVEYWVNVTAFDYGSPAQGVNPLETERTDGVRPVYPLTEHDAPISGSEQVYVYPNPYRVDANYRADGYEGRNQDDRWDERVRAIWFANLPPVCTIHIYTIDGDRVRTMDHRSEETEPTHRRKMWDLINRNFQKVETGLYYWVVEVPGGQTQMGKLAIIR